MELKFLSQGFEETSGNSIGNHIIKNLESSDFSSFTAFSAFTSLSAIEGLKPYLLKAKATYNSINLILGVNQKGTSKETLEEIVNLNLNSFVFYHSQNYIFHPKIYLFEGEEKCKLIIGSSNLTAKGLFSNIEASTLITLNPKSPEEVQFLEEIKSYYKTIFDYSDPNLKLLTKILIDNLLQEGIIPTEAESQLQRKLNNSSKKGPGISKIFPSRKVPQIPSYFKRNKKKSISLKAPKNQNLKLSADYKYNEPSYHFPQGVHIGHILYVLKILDNNEIKTSYLNPNYIRLRGNFEKGKLGQFQRKIKYLLIALMEMRIINDNRNLEDSNNYQLKLTTTGIDLAKILKPLLSVSDLKFKSKSTDVPSMEMIARKEHYKELVKAIISTSSLNLIFWRELIMKMPAVNLMLDFLQQTKKEEVPKTDFIYGKFFKYPPTVNFHKSSNLKLATEEGAKHRLPFLLDLLEIGQFLDQERSFVVVKEAE